MHRREVGLAIAGLELPELVLYGVKGEGTAATYLGPEDGLDLRLVRIGGYIRAERDIRARPVAGLLLLRGSTLRSVATVGVVDVVDVAYRSGSEAVAGLLGAWRFAIFWRNLFDKIIKTPFVNKLK